MKRIWFAVAFLVICISLCVGEQYYIKDFYRNLEQRCDNAIKYSETNDERLDGEIKEIKDYWEKHNDLIFTLTNHGVLDDLSAHLRALDSDSDPEELKKVRATLEVFYENQKITAANIF